MSDRFMKRERALYPKERQYLLDAANGLTAAETAAKHFVAYNTVTSTLKRARAALGARSIAHAVAIALALGDIVPTEIMWGED